MKIIFVEGMPGCGKSTLTDNLSAMLRKNGSESYSHQELDKNQPVYVLREKETDTHSIEYLKNYLSRWEYFVKSNDLKNEVHVFDATPFQSFVRLAIEAGNVEKSSEYISELEKILSNTSSCLIYLKPDCPLKQTDYCIRDKGEVWGSKVSNYLEKTHFSKQHGWEGVAGMRIFWDCYVEICDSLVAEIRMPKKIIRSAPGEWDRVQEEVFKFVDEKMA